MSNQGDKHSSRYPSQSQPCFFVYLARRSPKRLCAPKYFDEFFFFLMIILQLTDALPLSLTTVKSSCLLALISLTLSDALLEDVAV